MGWLLWSGILLPVMLYGALMALRLGLDVFPGPQARPRTAASQDRLIAQVGERLAAISAAGGTPRGRQALPRLGPDERRGTRWVPPVQVGMSLRIHTAEGAVRAPVSDLSRQGFAAHVASARSWKQGELLTCTLELIGQPYVDVRVRTRYVVFGGDEDSSWRIGFQLEDPVGGRAGRAVERLVQACEAARLAA